MTRRPFFHPYESKGSNFQSELMEEYTFSYFRTISFLCVLSTNVFSYLGYWSQPSSTHLLKPEERYFRFSPNLLLWWPSTFLLCFLGALEFPSIISIPNALIKDLTTSLFYFMAYHSYHGHRWWADNPAADSVVFNLCFKLHISYSLWNTELFTRFPNLKPMGPSLVISQSINSWHGCKVHHYIWLHLLSLRHCSGPGHDPCCAPWPFCPLACNLFLNASRTF